ncbi:MAG: hypothetical protein WD030_09850 [Pirellulales bacterium]
MKLELNKKWFEDRILLEDDSDVAAGIPPSEDASDDSKEEEMSNAKSAGA